MHKQAKKTRLRETGDKPARRELEAETAERKRMEEQLKESEAKFSKAFQANPLAMSITTQKDDRYIDVNEAFEKLSGYRRAEVVGRTTFDLGLYEDPRKRDEAYQLFSIHGRLSNFEIRYRSKNGDIITCLVFVEPIELASEPCVIATVMNITERKRAEEEVKKLNRDLECRARELDALNRAGQMMMSSTLDLDAVLGIVMAEVRDLLVRRVLRCFCRKAMSCSLWQPVALTPGL